MQVDQKGMAPDPIEQLGRLVLEQAGERDAIGDSDLDDEQPVSVTISTTLGLLRKAGLRYVPAYFSQAERERAEARAVATGAEMKQHAAAVNAVAAVGTLDANIQAWQAHDAEMRR